MVRRSRDWVTNLLALGLGFMGFVVFLAGLAVFASGPAGVALGGPAYGAIVAAAGFLLLPAAVGVWRLNAWGWWLGVTGSVVIAIAIVALGPNKVGVVFQLVVLGFLVLVKDDFRIGRAKVVGRHRNRGGGPKRRRRDTARSNRRSKD